jgi:hypothetical protein
MIRIISVPPCTPPLTYVGSPSPQKRIPAGEGVTFRILRARLERKIARFTEELPGKKQEPNATISYVFIVLSSFRCAVYLIRVPKSTFFLKLQPLFLKTVTNQK